MGFDNPTTADDLLPSDKTQSPVQELSPAAVRRIQRAHVRSPIGLKRRRRGNVTITNSNVRPHLINGIIKSDPVDSGCREFPAQ
jgi:hypothetical protein